MKKYIILSGIAFVLFWTSSCSDQDEITEPPEVKDVEVQDFIWKGMNIFYLWQKQVTDLSDTRFTTDEEYLNYLYGSDEPEEFFESLIYNRRTVDFWSWIVDDYIELENSFQGISKSNGVEFGLGLVSSGSDQVIGYVRYIMPGSDADGKDIKRGDIFYPC